MLTAAATAKEIATGAGSASSGPLELRDYMFLSDINSEKSILEKPYSINLLTPQLHLPNYFSIQNCVMTPLYKDELMKSNTKRSAPSRHLRKRNSMPASPLVNIQAHKKIRRPCAFILLTPCLLPASPANTRSTHVHRCSPQPVPALSHRHLSCSGQTPPGARPLLASNCRLSLSLFRRARGRPCQPR